MKKILSGNLLLLFLCFLAMQLNYKGYAQSASQPAATPASAVSTPALRKSICVNGKTQLTSALPTGGTMSVSNGYTIHTFTGSGTLTVPTNFIATAEVLIVGGGGGGGYRHAGGGGAGGLIHMLSYALNATQQVVVGAGGAGNIMGSYSSTNTFSGDNGGQSLFGSSVAIGGGGGGNNNYAGQPGGSGGGGSNSTYGGSGTQGQGMKGGDQNYGQGCCHPFGAGGGGFNAAGANTDASHGSAGGIGISVNISGLSINYAGGGGGGQGFDPNPSGADVTYQGGIGGGGAGGTEHIINGSDGLPNTGGGGGGGGASSTIYNNNSGNGGTGGSGIVIVKYPQPTIVWSSNNTNVATVDASGLVTGISGGIADITHVITSGSNTNTYTSSVTVVAIAVPIITASGSTSTCAGNSVVLSCNAGNALQFVGGNYAESNNPALPIGNASRTMEAWIKTSSINTSSINGAIVNYGTLSNNERFGMLMVDNKLYFTGEVNDVIGNITINDGLWHHVAVVYDGSIISLYVDGILDVSKSISALETTGTTVRIAKRLVGDMGVENFTGAIDEVRIWNITKTQQQLQTSMNYSVDASSAGLMAYYKMDDAAGSTTSDASLNHITSTLIGGPLTVVSTAPINNYASYLWSTNESTSSITVDKTSSITLAVTNAFGCSSVTPTATLVTVSALPVMAAQLPATVSIPCGSTKPEPSTLLFTGGSSDASTFSPVAGTCGGQFIETWTAKDACGNALAPVSRIVTVSQNMGSVQSFVLFSGNGAVSNTGASTISGDVGSNVGAVAGFSGPVFTATASTNQANIDLMNLYIHLSNIPVTNTEHAPSFGGGETITPGVYLIAGAGAMAGNLILDGQNNSNSVFVLKFNGAFSPAVGSTVSLINGLSANNVFWMAEGAISIGASSTMKGTFIAHTGAATMGATGDLEGRLLSTDGAVGFGPGAAYLPTGVSSIPVIYVDGGSKAILGSAAGFTLFSSAGAVSNTGNSGIIGNIGTGAGAISGFDAPNSILIGSTNNADGITALAVTDLQSAYTNLKSATTTISSHAAAFGGGETLTTGVYEIAAAGSLDGTLTLDGGGNPNAQFIFKFGGAFSAAAQSKIILVNGASHHNVFWVVEGAISTGALTFMKGTFIANNGAVTLGARGNLEGSLFSTAGAISINTGVAYNSYIACTSDLIVPQSSAKGAVASIAASAALTTLAEEKLSIYPNPSKGVLHLGYSGDISKVRSIDISDGLGKSVFHAGHYQSVITLNNAAGIYFVRVHLDSKVVSYKIVVNK